MNNREMFMAVLGTQPLLESDAVIVLCGQDGQARAEIGAAIMLQEGAGTLVLSGGRSEPVDGILGAEDLVGVVMGKGVAPHKVLTETGSMNTAEQAHEVLALATERQWKRLILVASPYHVYRAFLTFLGELQNEGLDRVIHMIALPASHTPWFEPPPGRGRAIRLDLLEGEFNKMVMYSNTASCGDGLDYLEYWEGK